MAGKKPVVIVTRKLPEVIEIRLMELFDARLNVSDHPFSPDELKEALKVADVLVPTITDDLNAEVLACAGPQLRLIANFGAGVDHIDLTAAARRNIIVTNTPGVLTNDTADVAMALILAVPRRIAEGERLVRTGGWTGWTPTFMLGRRLEGKRLGIVGMGRIGQAVAHRARAFGMSIHYHNRKRVHPEAEAELEATYWANLDEMLSRVDVVSLHCPLTAQTRHLLSVERLKRLRPHSYVINTARGELIDEAALVDALNRQALAGAGLEVFEFEPRIHPKLLEMDNVTLLPHMGSATIEAREEMGEKVVINIKSFVDGHRPPDRVLANLL